MPQGLKPDIFPIIYCSQPRTMSYKRLGCFSSNSHKIVILSGAPHRFVA
jgi:hypothetical protein